MFVSLAKPVKEYERMYLSRLVLNTASPSVRRAITNVDTLHRLVLKAFSENVAGNAARAELGVLYRVDHTEVGAVTLTVQSDVEPKWTRLEQGFVSSDAGSVASKNIDTAWTALHAKQALLFRLRANPTKKIDTKTGPDGRRRNGRRVPLNDVLDQIAWLRRKGLQHGFELVDVTTSDTQFARVLDFPQATVHGTRRRNDKVETLTFGAVVFEGILEISDVDLFREGLKNGVGTGKAFGFGLLSIAAVK